MTIIIVMTFLTSHIILGEGEREAWGRGYHSPGNWTPPQGNVHGHHNCMHAEKVESVPKELMLPVIDISGSYNTCHYIASTGSRLSVGKNNFLQCT